MRKTTQTRSVRVLCLVLALMLLLSACSSTNPPSTSDSGSSENNPTNTGDAALAAEQVLNLRYTETDRLDVNDSRNQNEWQVLMEVQEGLFRTFTDENGLEEVAYAGCTSYDVSDDGLVWTFYLREESVWSDGVPVTAQNYVDSWLRVLDPEGTFPSASTLFGIVGAEEYYYGEGSKDAVGVEAVDDHTFRVTLETYDATFFAKIKAVPFYPIRLDLIEAAEAAGDDWNTDYTLHVFNGPFVISDRVLENSMTLTKNETYWDADNVSLTQVNLRVIDETSTAATLLETQQLDIMSLGSSYEYIEKWQSLIDDGTFVQFISDSPATYMLIIDQHEGGNGGPSGLMQNAKVRLAMALALDREEFIDLFQSGYNTPAYGLIPSGMKVGDLDYRSAVTEPLLADEYQAIASDPDALRALFEEGAREAGYTGDIADITLVTLKYNPSTTENDMLEWFKQQFESKLGCKAEIVIYPDLSGEQTGKAEYQWDYYEQGWGVTYNEPVAFLEMWSSSSAYSSLTGGFSNAEFDDLIAQIKACQDDAERLELTAQAEEILIIEAGLAPLYYSQRQIYYQSYVQNLSLPMFGGPFEFSRAYILAH